MRRIITIAFLCFFQLCVAQNFYEIKWKGESGIKYTALVEFFEKENIKVRVKYTVKDGTYKVAKYKCVGKYLYNEDGTKYFVFDGEDAEMVYSSKESTVGYSADNFVFKNMNANNEFEKLYTYDDQDLKDGKLDNIKDATFKKLDPAKDFTKAYIHSFFWTNEPEYTTYTSLISSTASTSTTTNTSSSSSSSSSSSTVEHYRLKFRNKCNKPVKVLIRYLNFEDEWKSKGWWEIAPNKTVYVEDSKNRIFYFYAKTTDGKLVWSDKDNKRDFKGKKYGFRKLEKSNSDYGSWISDITCTNQTSTQSATTSTSTGTTTGNQFNKNVKLHLLMVADTNDPQIGSSVEQDLNDVTNLFRKAAREIGIKYGINKLYGNTFDKSSIMSKINSLGIKPNDVVIFYYSGHGYNDTSGSNRFPNMSLDGSDLGLESIHRYIKSKGARLSITVGDLCNSIPRTRDGIKSDEEIPFKSGFLFDEDKLKRLFIYSKGSLISTSSGKGEWSFCMTNSNGSMGNGHFTNAFINSFAKEASKVNDNNGSWRTMFSRAYNEAKSRTQYQRNQNGRYGQSGFNSNTITYN
ncbi:DUF1036 domain-containing protein [Kordia sp. YSTF-M3]|uniref:DUF1036 domain-containing protein n=1 Tax=Kordia aestuariivivens TaxID=2759037 RepID=A0ABR7QC34_9FLAO|nr:DUF1036 domain-containing protein [Kordia aestuariivivens]MBC8756078.1 DUF1036 domain-containing protein [Kordia aestuariivivens]